MQYDPQVDHDIFFGINHKFSLTKNIARSISCSYQIEC